MLILRATIPNDYGSGRDSAELAEWCRAQGINPFIGGSPSESKIAGRIADILGATILPIEEDWAFYLAIPEEGSLSKASSIPLWWQIAEWQSL